MQFELFPSLGHPAEKCVLVHRVCPQGELLPCKSQLVCAATLASAEFVETKVFCRARLHLCLILVAVQLTHVIGEVPQGRQVLIGPICFAAISNGLSEIAKRVPLRPDNDALPESLL